MNTNDPSIYQAIVRAPRGWYGSAAWAESKRLHDQARSDSPREWVEWTDREGNVHGAMRKKAKP